jgi:hypothetical protein
VLALVLAGAGLGGTLEVRLVDAEGNLLYDCSGVITGADGALVTKIEPSTSGRYFITASMGQKLHFDVGHPILGAFTFDKIVPAAWVLVAELLGGPANDNCPDAAGVDVPGSFLGTTTGSTNDREAQAVGFCGTSVSNPSFGVWHTVIGTGNVLTATTCNGGTNYDTKLTVYCQDCPELACIGGNDDQAGAFDPACDVTGIGSNRGSTVSWCSQAGAVYRVFVHGFLAASGNYELTVEDSGTPCVSEVDCLPPTPTGACCTCLLPPYNCTVETAEVCAARGGIYQADGTACNQPGTALPALVADPNLAIPDDDPVGVTTTIAVADSFGIGDLNVGVAITHTFLGDLIVRLTHPSGSPTVTLFDGLCGTNNNMNVTFDDDGGPLVCASPTVGTVDPANSGGGPSPNSTDWTPRAPGPCSYPTTPSSTRGS